MGSMLANVSFNIFAQSASKKGGKKKKENIRFLGLMYVTWQHEYIRSSTETYNSSTVHWISSLFIFIWTLINVLAYCLEISRIFLPFCLILSIHLKGYDMPSYKVTVSWECFWALCSSIPSIFQCECFSLLLSCLAPPCQSQDSPRSSVGTRQHGFAEGRMLMSRCWGSHTKLSSHKGGTVQ